MRTFTCHWLLISKNQYKHCKMGI